MWAQKKVPTKIQKKKWAREKNVGANVSKKKSENRPHFFVKVVGSFSEKKNFWKSKSKE